MELPLHENICATAETGFIKGTESKEAQWDECNPASYTPHPLALQMSPAHEAHMCRGAHGCGTALALTDAQGQGEKTATGSGGRGSLVQP